MEGAQDRACGSAAFDMLVGGAGDFTEHLNGFLASLAPPEGVAVLVEGAHGRDGVLDVGSGEPECERREIEVVCLGDGGRARGGIGEGSEESVVGGGESLGVEGRRLVRGVCRTRGVEARRHRGIEGRRVERCGVHRYAQRYIGGVAGQVLGGACARRCARGLAIRLNRLSAVGGSRRGRPRPTSRRSRRGSRGTGSSWAGTCRAWRTS